MVTIIAHTLLFSYSATCAAEPTTPNITRSLSGPALNGPVVFVLTMHVALNFGAVQYL